MPRPAIIFDLGGVLIDWNPRYLYRKLIPDESEMERFLADVCTPAWNLQQDAGRPFAEGVAELVATHPDLEPLITAYYERWDEMLGDALDGTVAILRTLRDERYELHALTNWSCETFPIARQRFPFLTWFEQTVVSGEERTAKPDPRIYRSLLDRIARRADECVFIDDSAPNVATATRLGFDAIRFENPPGLAAALASRGIAV
jgi:2-haloacid dehalogenase